MPASEGLRNNGASKNWEKCISCPFELAAQHTSPKQKQVDIIIFIVNAFCFPLPDQCHISFKWYDLRIITNKFYDINIYILLGGFAFISSIPAARWRAIIGHKIPFLPNQFTPTVEDLHTVDSMNSLAARRENIIHAIAVRGESIRDKIIFLVTDNIHRYIAAGFTAVNIFHAYFIRDVE